MTLKNNCYFCNTKDIDEWLISEKLPIHCHRACLEYNINNQINEDSTLGLLINEFRYILNNVYNIPRMDTSIE
jgi:hypothetical protein